MLSLGGGIRNHNTKHRSTKCGLIPRERNEVLQKLKEQSYLINEGWGKSDKFLYKRWSLSRELKILCNSMEFHKGYNLNSYGVKRIKTKQKARLSLRKKEKSTH